MKQYIAIVKNSNNKVDKYQDFDSKSEADAHVADHGGFVVERIDGAMKYWVVDNDKKTVTLDKTASDAGKNKRDVMAKINSLEEEVTARRIRDAVLGTDSDWLKNKEAEIASERGKL
jgi:hypothetical protein